MPSLSELGSWNVLFSFIHFAPYHEYFLNPLKMDNFPSLRYQLQALSSWQRRRPRLQVIMMAMAKINLKKRLMDQTSITVQQTGYKCDEDEKDFCLNFSCFLLKNVFKKHHIYFNYLSTLLYEYDIRETYTNCINTYTSKYNTHKE